MGAHGSTSTTAATDLRALMYRCQPSVATNIIVQPPVMTDTGTDAMDARFCSRSMHLASGR
jgi:hypothetical protein